MRSAASSLGLLGASSRITVVAMISLVPGRNMRPAVSLTWGRSASPAGDVLVFLPGFGEQRRVAERLQGDPVLEAHRATLHVLHGSLPLAEQDAAIAPA